MKKRYDEAYVLEKPGHVKGKLRVGINFFLLMQF